MRLSRLLWMVVLFSCAGASLAQTYPDRALRLIVPFGAGGNSDFAARQIGKSLGDALGQTVVVENRGGAGGVLGVKEMLGYPADGYTLLLGTVGTQIVNTLLYKHLPYDPDKQLAPVGLATNTPSVLVVRASLPVRTLDELIAYARARPGVLNYGAAGTLHLGMETLKASYGLDIVKVPYKGSGESVTAVAGGQIDVLMDSSQVVGPQVAAGKLRALAVMSDQPLASVPGVPTTAQLGVPDLKAGNWTALYVAVGTPAAIQETLSRALQKVVASAELKARLADYGTQLYKGSPEEYRAFIAADKAKVRRLVEIAGLQAQ